jgi:hypothetical protein
MVSPHHDEQTWRDGLEAPRHRFDDVDVAREAGYPDKIRL